MLLTFGTYAQLRNVSVNRPVTVSSELRAPENVGSFAVDGINDPNNGDSRWVSGNGFPHSIYVQLDQVEPVSQVAFYTGYNGYNRPINDYVIQYWDGAGWQDIISRVGNNNSQVSETFAAVETDRIRLYMTRGEDGYARIFELAVLVNDGGSGGGTDLGAGNGLTLNEGDLDLGGSLTAPVSIDFSDYSFNMYGYSNGSSDQSSFNLTAENDQRTSTFIFHPNEIFLGNAFSADFDSFLRLNQYGASLSFHPGGGLLFKQIDLTGSSMLIRDDLSSKGLEYNADYSANFTDRSLVDKAYVDNIISTGGGSGAGNGLTLNAGNLDLGGDFSQDINLASSNGSNFQLSTPGDFDISGRNLAGDLVKIESADDQEGSFFTRWSLQNPYGNSSITQTGTNISVSATGISLAGDGATLLVGGGANQGVRVNNSAFRLDGTSTINGYSFPTKPLNGIAGQVLTTDGEGNLSFQSGGGSSSSQGAIGNFNVSDGAGGFDSTDVSYDFENRNFIGAGASFDRKHPNSDNNFIYGQGININDNVVGAFDHNFIVGNNHTIDRIAGGSTRWLTITGEEHSIINRDPNGDDTINNLVISGGYANSVIKTESGIFGIFESSIIGTSLSTIEGSDLTGANIVAGNRITNKASRSLAMGMKVHNEGFGSLVFGGDAGVELDGEYTLANAPVFVSAADSVNVYGKHAVVITANSTAQTEDHGVYSDFGTVLGGVDHHLPEGADFSSIIGGEAIKASDESHTVYMPRLKLGQGKRGTLDEGVRTDSLLVMSSDGSVNFIPQSSLSVGGAGASSTIRSEFNATTGFSDYTNNVGSWEVVLNEAQPFASVEGVNFGTGQYINYRNLEVGFSPFNYYVFEWIPLISNDVSITATVSINDISIDEIFLGIQPGIAQRDTIFLPNPVANWSNGNDFVRFLVQVPDLDEDRTSATLLNDYFASEDLLGAQFSVNANPNGVIIKKGDETNLMVINNDGFVGIGTSSPDEKLTVNGEVHAREIRIDLNVPGPDYVFEPTYNLPSLEDMERYINKNKHLPYIPSAKEMEKEGIKVGDNQMSLLRTVEELVLHQIALQKQMNELLQQNLDLKKEIEELKED